LWREGLAAVLNRKGLDNDDFYAGCGASQYDFIFVMVGLKGIDNGC